jgi:hypothetical protein
MAAFEYRQAEELRAAFSQWGVRYLFLGKSGAILLGFPDTTQDVDIFPERSPENGDALHPTASIPLPKPGLGMLRWKVFLSVTPTTSLRANWLPIVPKIARPCPAC